MNYDPLDYWVKRYRRQGVHYVAKGGRAASAKEQYRIVAPFVQHALEEIEGGVSRVLDFGCGPQRFRPVVDAIGASYDGVDLIPGLGTMDLSEDGGLSRGAYDAVLALWVLQHIVDEAQYCFWVGQMFESLRPGGRLIVVDCNPPEPGHRMDAHMGPRGPVLLHHAAPWDSTFIAEVEFDNHWLGWTDKPQEPVSNGWTPPARPAGKPKPAKNAHAAQQQRVRIAETAPPSPLPPAPGLVVRDPKKALVLGGAECVWDDVRAIEEMLGHEWDGLVVCANDIMAHWPRPVHHVATLHPEKLAKWIELRRVNGYDDTYTTWSRKGRVGANRQVQAWGGGSSGLLAVTVAIEHLECDRIVLCGVPMTSSPHFQESSVHVVGRRWTSVESHWKVWQQPKIVERMQGRVRSMSGRTQELLGAPDPAWLTPPKEATDNE